MCVCVRVWISQCKCPPGATCELCSVSAFTAASPDVAFKAANLIKNLKKNKTNLAMTGYVFWRVRGKGCVVGGGR